MRQSRCTRQDDDDARVWGATEQCANGIERYVFAERIGRRLPDPDQASAFTTCGSARLT